MAQLLLKGVQGAAVGARLAGLAPVAALGSLAALGGSRGVASAAADDDELEAFREQVRAFAASEVAPHAAAIDEGNSFPKEVNLWAKLGEFGLHGLTVPEEKGGLGLGYAYHCVAMEEISRASASVALR